MTAIATMLERVRRAVIRRGGTPDDAEDIVQEAFARLEAYAQSHEVRSQEAFLMRAGINISRDEARRRRVSPFEPGEIAWTACPTLRPTPTNSSVRASASGAWAPGFSSCRSAPAVACSHSGSTD